MLILEQTSNFIGNSKTIYFDNNFNRNCLYAIGIHPIIYFVLVPFHLRKAMSQLPCFDIEYSRSCRPFLLRKLQWSKIQNIYIVLLWLFNFQYNNVPLRWLSTKESYDYPIPTFIWLSISIFFAINRGSLSYVLFFV